MNKFDKSVIFNHLNENKLMSLATYDKDPWSAVVYFLFDEEFNFYFLSPTDSLHCKNIASNPKVSLTVADSHQKASEEKVGFQMSGVASRVKNIIEVKKVILMWNKRHADTPPVTYKLMMKMWKSRFYKIVPTKIKMFNQKLWGEDGEKTWNF